MHTIYGHPERCVIVVVTARQSTRGPILMVSLRQVVGGVAAAWRRWILHGGGLPVLCGLHLSVPVSRLEFSATI